LRLLQTRRDLASLALGRPEKKMNQKKTGSWGIFSSKGGYVKRFTADQDEVGGKGRKMKKGPE